MQIYDRKAFLTGNISFFMILKNTYCFVEKSQLIIPDMVEIAFLLDTVLLTKNIR